MSSESDQRRVGDPEAAKEASVHIGFALDELVETNTSCCNIDNAIKLLKDAHKQILEYQEWANLDQASEEVIKNE